MKRHRRTLYVVVMAENDRDADNQLEAIAAYLASHPITAEWGITALAVEHPDNKETAE